eukprot:7969464-Pyramimonas_sp.AAC.1
MDSPIPEGSGLQGREGKTFWSWSLLQGPLLAPGIGRWFVHCADLVAATTISGERRTRASQNP